MQQPSRRRVLLAVPAGLAALGLAPHAPAANHEPADVWPDFPQQPRSLVAELVGASHRDIDRVRSLLDAHPALVNAGWDWGFGDWETPLGAASHTGRRAIAELLLERGARLDIFAAAMLGNLDAVRAMIDGSPGVQRAPGPHGITLLAHAKAGGDAAQAVTEYLTTRGDADTGQPIAPVGDEARASIARTYATTSGTEFRIRFEKNNLDFVMNGSPRRLHHLGNGAYFPSGVPSVTFRFAENVVTITDHDLVVTATAR